MILLKCCKNVVVVFFETILTEKFTTKSLIVQTNSVNTKLSNSNLRN